MLELQNIYKTFNAGTINQKNALNGINLKLNDGDFVTVIGGNGAGKSTTLNAIAGVWPVDSGKILIDGNMSIEENMALAARRGKHRGLGWGVTHAEREIYREKLATLQLGLEDRLTAKVGLLSGGQRQAITLLMATLQQPKLLLLDEHTAALDPKTAEKVLQATDQIIAKNHLTAIMVTHNMKDAIAHGNRLVMLHDGRIILDIGAEEKKKLTVQDLLAQFERASGDEFTNDRALLS